MSSIIKNNNNKSTTKTTTTTTITTTTPTTSKNQKQYDNSHTWENVESHIWEATIADDQANEGNTEISTSQQLAETIRKRRRLLSKRDYGQSSRRIIRDMIRYIYIVIDMSSSMREKDMTLSISGSSKTRLDVVLRMALKFVGEFYDQNPLSHIGIILLKDGEAEMLTQLSGSSRAHTNALEALIQSESGTGPTTGGEMSLQNGLEVAGRSLGHMPNYGSREVLLLIGALSTSDPGDVLCETLPRLKQAKIRVSCVALVAEMHVCKRITEVTGGIMGVSMDGGHLRDLIMGQCVPPPTIVSEQDQTKDSVGNKCCEFVQMGFPIRESSDVPSLIHVTRDKKMFGLTGYICPRCRAKASDLPTDCAVCGLKLVLAPHLARSFHHLFPVPPFVEVPDDVQLKDIYKDLNIPEQISSNDAIPNAISSTDPITQSKTSSSSDVIDGTLVINSTYCDWCCYGCMKIIPTQKEQDSSSNDQQPNLQATNANNNNNTQGSAKKRVGTVQEPSLRFQCPDCLNIFCADCDAYLHETLHNCPGCLCKG